MKHYKKEDLIECPKCKSKNIDSEEEFVENEDAYVSCIDCGHPFWIWIDPSEFSE